MSSRVSERHLASWHKMMDRWREGGMQEPAHPSRRSRDHLGRAACCCGIVPWSGGGQPARSLASQPASWPASFAKDRLELLDLTYLWYLARSEFRSFTRELVSSPPPCGFLRTGEVARRRGGPLGQGKSEREHAAKAGDGAVDLLSLA